MKIKKLSLLLGLVVALAMMGTPVFGAVYKVEDSTEDFMVDTTIVTSVTWGSSFADEDYEIGQPIAMSVNWLVTPGGAATYDSFTSKHCTPKGRDSADGDMTALVGGNPVTFTFTFTDLHLANDNIDIGNAHFKLWLMVDEDGDPDTPKVKTGFGVNLHVEAPQ